MTTKLPVLEKFRSGDVRVGVIGLGYVGMPLARAFIEKGVPVLGFDVDPVKVAKLREGVSYIGHIDSEVVRGMREKGFDATTDFGRLDEVDAVLICVPTPLSESRDPDLSYVVASARAIAARLRPGQLIVLESTTYPGTTRDVVLPILTEGGLQPGVDFLLAYSPEREDPGNPDFSAPTIPKVVGGFDEASREAASALYARIVVRVVPVSTLEIAEACKILENTYRAVNIALVNELKVLYDRMGVDVWEVIAAAKTKPFGFQAFYPGPGLGGHCIPIDPFYLSWVARKHGLSTRFIELAGEINTSMPAYVVGRIADALNDRSKPLRGSKVTILGMAYKKDVDDPRESPGFELMELLLNKGADVEYNDPHIPVLPTMRHYPNLRMSSRELTPDYVRSRDCLLVATDHSAYDWPRIVEQASLIVDTRDALRGVPSGRATILRA
ncbi:nucleotide sugar dehydrogenase [Planctomyces sp. SH-PL62]|uniref:nucleotide sugar dehydrogenase n=1 Tax=Planctomyces sp. SH-PL62 TaxID=1636152 RepID=UPI00078B9D7A|nr:nucleotide sugar dehydrogenase [Planctomyces sp. SH-PL62]AMV37479.1 UDP-N-acetyl-D-glucosamine 6-dehydrogenase [Planctomyces sp. SH-PL62]